MHSNVYIGCKMTFPSESIKNWARSMSGCDGGNPHAPVWLCGIEWGGAGKEDGAYYKLRLLPEIKNGGPLTVPSTYSWKEHNSYRFGKSFSKLYAAYRGQRLQNFLYYTNSLSGEEIFKLNLYPIAFDSTDEVHWQAYGLDLITGFSQKHLFNLWCEYHRFPYFSELRAKHSPELIICCGLNYLSKFLQFFGATASDVARLSIEQIPCDSTAGRNSPRRMYVTTLGERTLFACIPFFTNSYGLNSDNMLSFVGRRLSKLRT